MSLALAVSLAVAAPMTASGKDKDPPGGGVVVPTPPPLACSLTDLSVTASACSGYFAGNLLNNSSADVTAQTSALAALGLTAWDGGLAEPKLSFSTGAVNFSTALYGMTYVGIHFADAPGSHTPGGVTGFYRFDAGSNLDAFNVAIAAGAARLYRTQAAPLPFEPPAQSGIAAIPEPATWLMMILGFGGVGGVLRARRGKALFA